MKHTKTEKLKFWYVPIIDFDADKKEIRIDVKYGYSNENESISNSFNDQFIFSVEEENPIKTMAKELIVRCQKDYGEYIAKIEKSKSSNEFYKNTYFYEYKELAIDCRYISFSPLP